MSQAPSKEERFKNLVENYALAYYLSIKLIESGLLERKIKVTDDSYDDLLKQFTSAFASDIRQGLKRAQFIANTHNLDDDYFGSAAVVANSYFEELRARGDEWENADLNDLFTQYKIEAEKQIELDRQY